MNLLRVQKCSEYEAFHWLSRGHKLTYEKYKGWTIKIDDSDPLWLLPDAAEAVISRSDIVRRVSETEYAWSRE